MLINILYIIGGLIALVVGGNWLLRSSVDLAAKFGLSKIVIGLTVVSFATSAPELIVSINAALNNVSSIALGNVIGSNVANIGLVLGITVLITPLTFPKRFFKTDWLFLVIVYLIFTGLLFWNNDLSRIEGFILIALLVLYVWYLLKRKEDKSDEVEDLGAEIHEDEKWSIIIFYFVLGGLGLWLGAELLIRGAVDIAHTLNVKESVIGLTIVAFGTSVPELAASVIAATKGEKSISFGNLIGSNIFNILSVLGVTAIIQPFIIEASDVRFLNNDIWWMFGFAIILLPFAYLFKRNNIGKTEGIILIAAYSIYIYLAF